MLPGRLTPELNYEADAAIKAVIGDSEGEAVYSDTRAVTETNL